MGKLYDLTCTVPGVQAHTAMSDDIVCVGDALRDCNCPPSLRYNADVAVMEWPLLAERLSTGRIPQTVFSAAVSQRFDCLDIATLLHRAGFTGRLCVLACGMPDPAVIRRDVAESCPGLDFEVVTIVPAPLVRYC